MLRDRRTLLLCLPMVAILVLAFPVAHAQPARIPLAATGPMFERLVGNAAPAAGNFLVGVTLGEMPTHFDPDDIAAELPDYLRGRPVCVSIASEDGRYFAENPYKVPVNAAATMVFSTPTKFGKILQTFEMVHMAVGIRLADSCDSPNMGAFIPVQTGGSLQRKTMTAFLNADPEDIQVLLLRDRTQVGAPAVCISDPTTIRIAFSSRCVLAAPADISQGGYALEITKRERFSKDVSRFPLFRDTQ